MALIGRVGMQSGDAGLRLVTDEHEYCVVWVCSCACVRVPSVHAHLIAKRDE